MKIYQTHCKDSEITEPSGTLQGHCQRHGSAKEQETLPREYQQEGFSKDCHWIIKNLASQKWWAERERSN